MNRRTVSSVLLPLVISVVCINCTSVGERRVAYQATTCTKAGFFSYPDSCQEYYECRDRRGSLIVLHIRCNEGEFFDDSFSECKPKKFVTSPLRCVQDVAEGGSVDVSSPDDVVDVSSPDDVVDGSSVDAISNSPESIQVDDATAGIDQDSLALVKEHVPENVTGASEDFGTVGPDVSGTSDSSVNETIIDNVEETVSLVPNLTLCDHMRKINRYATLVVSNLFWEEPFPDQMPYNVTQYNADLETAQNNTALWRHGDSISICIKRTLYRVSEYKREFERKLSINKDRIQDIAKEGTSQDLSDKLKSKIVKKQDEINNTEEALSSVGEPAVRKYIQKLFDSKTQELELMRQQVKFTSERGREFKEVLHFLESVRDGAPEVQDLFMHLQEQMNDFKANLIGDTFAFNNYSNWAVKGIDVLTKEKENLQKTQTENKAKIEKLEKVKEELNEKKKNLTNTNWGILQEKDRLLDAMDVKIQKFRKDTETLCKVEEIDSPTREELDESFTPYVNKIVSSHDSLRSSFNSFMISVKDAFTSSDNVVTNKMFIAKECNRILEENQVSLDLSEERKEMSELGMINFKKMNRIFKKINNSSQSIRELSGASPGLKREIRQINTELQNIQRHNEDLEMLRDGVQTSKESLLEIIKDCKVLQGKFESIKSKLDEMMDRGNAVASADDIVKARPFIDTSILDVQNELQQLEVPHMETCHRL